MEKQNHAELAVCRDAGNVERYLSHTKSVLGEFQMQREAKLNAKFLSHDGAQVVHKLHAHSQTKQKDE